MEGCRSVKRIFTRLFALLYPYFQGMTSRTGAPFWLGRISPYIPNTSMVSGFMASSRRKASVYGHGSIRAARAGMAPESATVTNSTKRALPSGSTRWIRSFSE